MRTLDRSVQARKAALPPNGASSQTQRGVVLFIALIVLVAMALAGAALMRSVDTENLITGNMAFKQAALQASDAGIEAAFAQLPTIIATHLDTDKTGTAQNYWYYSTTRKNDANGVPTTTPTSDTTTAAVPITWSDVPIATNVGGYAVQYVIDRLCEGPGTVTDIQGKCFADEPKGGGSKKAGAIVFSSSFTVYYRATVRVTGPRNTQSIVQSILGRGN